MIAWTEAAVTAALGLPGTGDATVVYSNVSTDTRTIEPGALFVALRGENHDGHAFVLQAMEAGATGAVVDHVPENVPANGNAKAVAVHRL